MRTLGAGDCAAAAAGSSVGATLGGKAAREVAAVAVVQAQAQGEYATNGNQ